MARRREQETASFSLFSFLDLLTGLVGVLMFMLLVYSMQLREVTNPIGEAVLDAGSEETDVSKAFFLEASRGWAVLLPEGLCARVRDLTFSGGFSRMLDKKIRMITQKTNAKPGETTAVILVRDESGIEVRNRLKRLLRTKGLVVGDVILDQNARTDKKFLSEQAKRMGASDRLFTLDLEDPELTNYFDLYVLDENSMPQPLKKR